ENQALDRSHLENSLQFHDYLGEVDEKRAERDAAFTNVRDLLSETIGNIKQLPSSSLEGMETEEIQALSVQVVSLDKLLNMRYGDSTEREPLHAELEALDKKAQDLLQRVDQVSSAMDVSLQPTIDKLDQAATRYAEASAHIREVLEDARALGLRPQPIE
ncbi:MAG: hypothetical protein J2P37_02930, partial [Ktedonobacteraceae bacterium]|nr:hypothetical protein [Ktedonobacteraceae bacterium]